MANPNYPLVQEPVYLANAPAPETLLAVRSGDPFVGGSLPAEARVKGLQPGYDLAGIPVLALTPESAAKLAGPQGA